MAEERRLGEPVPDWRPPPRPGAMVLVGRTVRLEPLAVAHAAALHRAFAGCDRLWDYMSYGPFTAAGYRAWVAAHAGRADPLFFALIAEGGPYGVASLMRIKPEAGSIEIGHICLAPRLQRSTAASEAIYLLADRVFRLGYRRLEWKCDALNWPSRRAAERFGFSYEGTFRQAGVVKGRNRDTAWFAITDRDWQGLAQAWATWLDPANFDAAGRQRQRLGALTAPWRVAADPIGEARMGEP